MNINVPKSLSVAAALHPEISAALDAAQGDAADAIEAFLSEHSRTRVGPRGKQESVRVERLETVRIVHRTSRAGDPHRHIHFQISTRVFGAGRWRALDTAGLLRQQGAIRAIGGGVIAGHAHLARVLAAHGFTLDARTGEVSELIEVGKGLSKRGEQVAANKAEFEAQWRMRNPGQEPGPVLTAKWDRMAWEKNRPAKKPAQGVGEEGWRAEIAALGFDPYTPRAAVSVTGMGVDDVLIEQIANRAIDRCAAKKSTWSRFDVHQEVGALLVEAGVRDTPRAIAGFMEQATTLAVEGTISVLPQGYEQLEHIPHLTSPVVMAHEARLREGFKALSTHTGVSIALETIPGGDRLDEGQRRAAAAVASGAGLVVIEGAAGAGKTTMLKAAKDTLEGRGGQMRLITPTLKAAQVAAGELQTNAGTVAKLLHDYGYRWNSDGVWHRLQPGQQDPASGTTYAGPHEDTAIRAGEVLVVDEAGMLDQDAALALVTITHENGARLALVGDRAQLSAVGRGGVLEMALTQANEVQVMNDVHRFTDPAYAELSLAMREGDDPDRVFDGLVRMGLVHLHPTHQSAQAWLGEHSWSEEDSVALTVATNEEATHVNEEIHDRRVHAGQVDGTFTRPGSDGAPIGAGDIIMTRTNNTELGVANRDRWVVQRLEADGGMWVRPVDPPTPAWRTVYLPGDYTAAHVHLGYATTAYGVQGATTTTSHTLLTDNLTSGGTYVGMTRAKEANHLHLVAHSTQDAREQFIAALTRDRADKGLQAAIQAAQQQADRYAQPLTHTQQASIQRWNADLENRLLRAKEEIEFFQELVAARTALPAKRHAVEQAQTDRNAAQTRLHATIIETVTQQWDIVAQAQSEADSAGIFTRKKATEYAQAVRNDFDQHWRTHGMAAKDIPTYIQHLATNPKALPAPIPTPITEALNDLEAATEVSNAAVTELEQVATTASLHDRYLAKLTQAKTDFTRLKNEHTRRQTLTPHQQYAEATPTQTQAPRTAAPSTAPPHFPAGPSTHPRGPGL